MDSYEAFLEKAEYFHLYRVMLVMTTLKKNRTFDKDSFDKVMREMAFQTKKVQSEHRITSVWERSDLKDRIVRKVIVHMVISRV